MREMESWADTIPLMAGTVFSEMQGTLTRGDGRKNEWTAKEVEDHLTETFGDNKDEVVAEFKQAFPHKKVQDVIYYAGGSRGGAKALLGRKLEKAKTPVYNYLFAWEYPIDGGITSFHCSELAFCFHALDVPQIRIATGGGPIAMALAGQGLAGVGQLRQDGQSRPGGARVEAVHDGGSAGDGIRHGQRVGRAPRRQAGLDAAVGLRWPWRGSRRPRRGRPGRSRWRRPGRRRSRIAARLALQRRIGRNGHAFTGVPVSFVADVVPAGLNRSAAGATMSCRMAFLRRRVRPPLDMAIEWIWLAANERQPQSLERVLPFGSAQLIVNLAEDETRVYSHSPRGLACRRTAGSVLTGLTTRFQMIDSNEQAHVAGVVFRPGGTVPFVASPALELTNCQVPLESLWGRARVSRLRQQVLASPGADAGLDALERALLEAWRDRSVHPAVRYALTRFQREPRVARIRAVTDTIALSPKRFIERFKADVGVTPKRYCRLLRFQRTVAAARRGPVDWPALALASGYFDQAHLIHEFREFSGMTPTAYEAQRTAFQNHVTFLQSAGDRS